MRKLEGSLREARGETGVTSAGDTSSFTLQEARGVQMGVNPNLEGPLTALVPWRSEASPGRGRGL